MWEEEAVEKPIERAIDPSRRIVDAHHHLWDFESRPTYMQEHFQRDAGISGHRVESSIYIECGAGYRQSGPEHLRSVGETETAAAAAAERTGADHVKVAAIVAHADLRRSDLDEVLDAHVEAGNGLFRGIRQSAAYDPDPSVRRLSQVPGPELMDGAGFRRGLERLAQRGFTYDAYIYHPQIAQLTALAAAVPQATIILNHMGTPLSTGRYAGHRDEVMAQWSGLMTDLARNENVLVKLGGIGLPLMGFEPRQHDVSPSSEDVANAWKPHVDLLIERFGTTRLVAESNFPADRATLSYGTLWNAIKRLIAELPDADQDLILSGNAERIYGI